MPKLLRKKRACRIREKCFLSRKGLSARSRSSSIGLLQLARVSERNPLLREVAQQL